MINKKILKTLLVGSLLILIIHTGYSQQNNLLTSKQYNKLYQKLQKHSYKNLVNYLPNYYGKLHPKIDTLIINDSLNIFEIHYKKYMAEGPIRPKHVIDIYSLLLKKIPRKYKKYNVKIKINNELLENYTPLYYIQNKKNADKKLATEKSLRKTGKSFIKKNKVYNISKGLQNRNIALWHSHGWYYENTLDRWEWQRARLFTTVEDIMPGAFVVPYILPMLENSGAKVFIPREIDFNTHEIIIDNDTLIDNAEITHSQWINQSNVNEGFKITPILDSIDNPFKNGTFLYGTASKKDSIIYAFNLPEKGKYMTYISYGKTKNLGIVKCRVYHAGTFTDYEIDQSIGAGVWLPLGYHYFDKQKCEKNGKVVFYVKKGQTMSIDAVKIGGGMGNITRNNKLSGKARFFESARYFLQYAGYPDTLVWYLNKGIDDYGDDYQCRGEWVNYLIGNCYNTNPDTVYQGLNVPIDMSLAFHTDAGILGGDSIIGTLAIYSDWKNNGFFQDNISRLNSRDLSDLIQTQLVNDISKGFDIQWTRRGMWNAKYSEAYRANTPTMLLELLSHQNMTDSKYMLDPQFRFIVSRAIYKGILRFLATQNGFEYVVQPLPVTNLKSEFINDKSVKISWKTTHDSLEPTAVAKQFIVYQRINEQAFDNGTVVDSNSIILKNLDNDKIYSFKIAALNSGGESFPSEVISIGISSKNKGTALIVNGFDRLEAPEYFESDTVAGYLTFKDQGVSYKYDFHTTGQQYDFNKKSKWLDDDSPGWGASFADKENLIYPANNFDYSIIHGKSILNSGYNFVTTSDECLDNYKSNKLKYSFVDFIYGEEKTKRELIVKNSDNFQIYNKTTIEFLQKLQDNQISIIISGAYIGTDMKQDTTLVKQIGNLLGFKWRTDNAVKTGCFYSTENNKKYKFITAYNEKIYPAESPDAIEPYNDKGETIFRYSENNTGAAVFYSGKNKVLSFGFPLECINNESDRNNLIKYFIQLIINK